MKKYLYVGKIVGTHGIKGEIKILCDKEYKNQVFVKDQTIFIDQCSYTIKTYRHHKNYEMITMEGYNNINQVLNLKDKKVYVLRSDIKVDSYLLDDLIGMSIVYNNNVVGIVNDYSNTGGNILLHIEGKNNFYIPKCSEYIDNIDLESKKIIVKNIGGLML